LVGKISDDIVIGGKFWLIVISSLDVEFIGVAVIVVPGAVLTRENCLKTWDNDGLPDWCGNIGTACWMLAWKFWLAFICEEVIDIICELLLPAAFAFANSDLTVWFEELILEEVPGLVRLAIVETMCGFDWTVAVLNVNPDGIFEFVANFLSK
jgi:hypothetical protein